MAKTQARREAGAPGAQTPTLGASYTAEPTDKGTALRNDINSIPSRWQMVAVVLPVCSGKTTLVNETSGYDIDDMVVNTEPLPCDKEWEQMIDAREAAVYDGDAKAHHLSNQLLLQRGRRFLQIFEGDSNAQILYVHTAELAVALGAEIVYVGSVAPSAIHSSARYRGYDRETAAVFDKLIGEQSNANRNYCDRHNIHYFGEAPSFDVLRSRVLDRLRSCGLLRADPDSLRAHGMILSTPNFRLRLNRCYDIVINKQYARWVQAVAARQTFNMVGDTMPQDSQHHHNHPRWARVIHAVEQHALEAYPGDYPPPFDWSERYPYGPGNSRFALAKIQDWLDNTTAQSYKAGYWWFKQILNRTDCSYERALCMLIMGDVWSYVAPDIGEFAYRLRIGGLNPMIYAEVTKAIHACVRSSNTLLGRKLRTRDLAVASYWDCLAGRYPGTGDMAKEIADRTVELEPRVFIMPDGTRSIAEFNARFKGAVRDVLNSILIEGSSKLQRAAEKTKSFDTFLEYRKMWVRPGSVTGSPKTDIFLKAVGEREAAISEVADDLHTMGMYVLRNVRLNKAATFEFANFPAIVKEALAGYVPNSFTRHFLKNEIGKPKGRALFPSHLVHYIVGSYVLYLLMKGAPIAHARLIPDDSTPRDEHWAWREARDFTVGLMLDYDNFNERHEFSDMKMIIHTLKDVYHKAHVLSPDMASMIDWVVEAYDKTILEYEGTEYRFLHGMLSGQAPTSMINTVINTANKRVIIEQIYSLYGEAVMTQRTSGGDDVAAEVYDAYMATMIVKVGKLMGFAFSASKQLISTTNYEFFRLFISSEGTYGSLPRALGSLCSGQWSNSVKAKFVDPASKLSSVVEIARKAARRAYGNQTFMEKLCNMAFKKWSTFGEVKLVEGFIHGSRDAGCLGVPRADGGIYEVVPVAKQPGKPVELIGLPDAASMVVAEEQVKEATSIVGAEGVETPRRLAHTMATSVFEGNIAAMEGVNVGQILSSLTVPDRVVVKYVKNIPRPLRTADPNKGAVIFRRDYARYKPAIEALRSAGRRYDALSAAVKEGYRRRLADSVAIGYGVDGALLHFWKERLTLYGCGTYMLTEDYYSAVQLLALVTTADYTDDAVSQRLAHYAIALDNSHLMCY